MSTAPTIECRMTKTHVERGMPNSFSFCAVALAVRAAAETSYVYANPETICIREASNPEFDGYWATPPKLSRWMRRFDRAWIREKREAIKPIAFVLDQKIWAEPG